ncbi:class I SAM-dependent methyltransferase [candidate division KSB1 bacterium]
MCSDQKTNKPIDIKDFNRIRHRIILDDIHRFLKVPARKRKSAERCHGKSLLEPAVFESYKHWDNPWAISHAGLISGMQVLDCGSGRGVLQFYLASKGVDVYSIDIHHNRSKSVVRLRNFLRKFGVSYTIDPAVVHKRLNRKYKVQVKFRQESAASLSFEPDFFDRIFSISVIEHMNDQTIQTSMREMERVLRPGGLLLLTFDFHLYPDDSIIGFTEDDFKRKVLHNCSLIIAGNEPDFSIPDWESYIREVNSFFRTKNPNTSYGVVLKKPLHSP